MKTCSIDDCGNEEYCRGWCQKHYARWHRTGSATATKWLRLEALCEADGCERSFRVYESDIKAGRVQKYCSQRCYWSFGCLGRPAGWALTTCQVDDENCRYSGPIVKGFCNWHYRKFRQYGEPTPPRAVCICGEEFERTRIDKSACSAICYDRARTGRVVHAELQCAHCGSLFAPKRAGVLKYCTKRCSATANRWRRRYREQGLFVEPVDRFTLGTRDDWICGICHGDIDPQLVYPDRASWSLDHVVPLSLGGEHSYANTQSSHWVCNIRKGNRVASTGAAQTA